MRVRSLPGAFVLACLLGCGPKDAPPSAATAKDGFTSHPIKAAAGGVAGDPAGAEVRVPPGALPKDATISLAQKAPETRSSPGVRVVGSVWSFQVDGAEHFSFSKPVRISLPVDSALKGPDASIGISVWSGECWEKVPGAHVDPASGKVVADVDHFSAFAPTQEEPGDPVERARDELRKVYFNKEYWYVHLVVTIRGSGSKRFELGGGASYTIQRVADLKFRLRADPGELAMISGMEQMKKFHGVSLPPEMKRAMEANRDRRHWMTEMMKPEKEDRTDVHIAIGDRYSASAPKTQLGELIEEASSTLQTLTGGMDAPVERNGNYLEIDVAKGTYSFSLGQVTGGVVEYHEERKSGDKSEETKPVDTKAPAGIDFKIKDHKLPGRSGILTGTQPISRDQLSYALKGVQGNWHFGFGRVRGTITWTLSPYPLEDVELVLAPKGYDDWLPEGGTSESVVGNTLPIEARLQGRGGGSTKAKMVDLVVRLSEVSREPGVCLNVPLQKGAETPDLQFKPGSGYTVEDEGTKVFKKDGEFDHLGLTLNCYDWGAWGTVVAQAVLKDGRILWATLDGDPSEDEVRVPKRDPESKIADQWKKEMKADDLKDLDDAEAQKGNRNNGDGLTMYEEYRGMIAQGRHTRKHPAGPDGFKPLSPRRKDLIVENTIGSDPAVLAGFRLLEKAAGIHVVELAKGELPESRQVNVNLSATMSAGPQHGLRLFNATLPQGTMGDTPRDYTRPAGSRERYATVTVDLKQIRDSYKADGSLPWTVVTEISETVAHELAHGMDVDHHGEGRTITIQDPSRLKIYDTARKRTTTATIAAVGEPNNEASGNIQCIMCYNSQYAYSYYSPDFLFMTSIAPPGSIFCTSPDGTGHNAPFEIDDPLNPGRKRKFPGVFGKANKGNCLEQMRIKD